MKFDRRLIWLSPALALVLVMVPTGERTQRRGVARTADPVSTEADAAEAPETEATSESERTASSRTGREPLGPDFTELATMLGLVLIVGVAGLIVLRRVKQTQQGGDDQGPLRVRQTVRVGQRHRLHAIEFEGRVLVVGDSEQGLSLLTEERLANHDADSGVDLPDTYIPRPSATPRETYPENEPVKPGTKLRDRFEPLLRHLQESEQR